ncbi:MAG: hypothetical protein QXI91_06190 [Candidatus Bathyarchaeia archaeon]
MDAKKKTAFLGLAFLLFLFLAYVENMFFFKILNEILSNHLLAVLMFFMHNILVVSLILLGMTFYVNLVLLNFFKREKYGNIVVEHPRPFAVTFAVVIIFISILRGATLIYGGVNIETLHLILLISTPIGIVEGYGVYLTLEKTLSRTISMKNLAYIYGIFFIAALMEVAFINALKIVYAE